MPITRDKKHLLVKNQPRAETYRRPRMKMDGKKFQVPNDRRAHGHSLSSKFTESAKESKNRRVQASIQVEGVVPGFHIQFESLPGVPLELSSLEAENSGIYLSSVTRKMTEGDSPQIVESAVIFVPDGKVSHFFKRFEAYSQVAPKQKGERRHENMIDRISDLRLATFKALWTDKSDYPKEDEIIAWEIWLRRNDGEEAKRFKSFARQASIEVSSQQIAFEDRIVLLVTASPNQLSASIDILNDVTEARRSRSATKFFDELLGQDQHEWAADLVRRVDSSDSSLASICILDTGINRGHPLLESFVSEEDLFSHDPSWGGHDDDGHGTEIAGIALYGDLETLLESSSPVKIRHCIESVKIIPPTGSNDPQLYGAISIDAVAQVEASNPLKKRCFSMAVTADSEGEPGEPTSWSAVIDALAAGRQLDASTGDLAYINDGEPNPRLFIVSAGNVRGDYSENHLDLSDLTAIEDPAQSWNCIAVGAYTTKANIEDLEMSAWNVVSACGDLSPFSRTSLQFSKKWPIKPDIVLEGGNLACDGSDNYASLPELSVLTTHYKPADRLFSLSQATSSACARAAKIAASITSEYPDYWPETIRGLLIQSADWTDTMKSYFNQANNYTAKEQLVRRYGFGVPTEHKALRSASDALTLISQSTIKPFSEGKMHEMHMHTLPWPIDVLESLGEARVRMRVTLSYFIEPNPGSRGWSKRYRYSSHGLRFEVKGATESAEGFAKRLNEKALAEGEKRPKKENDPGWFLGVTARSKGSLHSDIWTGTAADLASRGVIGIFPVSGWWKDIKKRDRSQFGCRYSLIVTIETPDVDVDIWTPVAEQIAHSIEVGVIG